MPSAHFIRGLQSYLSYWLAKTADLQDATIRQLNPDFPNVFRVVEMGLVLPETREKTAKLMLQCFFWVEQVGYIQAWQPLVGLAVQYMSDINNYLYFRLLKQLGQLQRLQYQLDMAVATFIQAEQLAHSLADKQALAETYMNLCQVYHLQGMYEEAERYGRLALDYFSDQQPRLRAITFRTLGIMAQEQGRLQQAQVHLQDSLALTGLPRERALTLNVLAVVFQQKEQPDQALQTYNDLLTFVDDITYANLFVEILLNKGSLLYKLECLTEAEVVFKDVEQLLKQRPGFLFHKARLANNLGCILREQARYLMAEKYFRRSIQQFALVNSDIYQANAWGNLAKLFVYQEKRAEAIACYDEALELVAPCLDNMFARELQKTYTRLRKELG